MRVYVAGPLFTPDERQRLLRVADAVEGAGGDPIVPFDEEGFEVGEDREAVYRSCIEGVAAADAVVAVLDGVDVDSGVAYEVGYARARGTPVLGIRTDYRTLGPEGPVNTMLAQGVSRLATPGGPDDEARAVADFLGDPPDEPEPGADAAPGSRPGVGLDGADPGRGGEAGDPAGFLKRFVAARARELAEAGEDEERDLLADLLEGVERIARERGLTSEALRQAKERRADELDDLAEGTAAEDPTTEDPS